MIKLQMKMWLLVALMFGILYGVITGIGTLWGIGNAIVYIAIAVLFVGLQYWFGPSIVSMMMQVRYVSEKEEPALHRQIDELSRKAGIPKPKVGISRLSIPNAFAFGRGVKDGLTNLLILYGSRIREYYADERSVKLGNPPHHLASALYKLVYGAARAKETVRGEEELRRVGAVRAFFLNDVERAWNEVKELREIDKDLSGAIDERELLTLRGKKPSLNFAEKIMEIFTTHPNMLKRVKRLSLLS
jgi:Zn-dependent protease with chaperone function